MYVRPMVAFLSLFTLFGVLLKRSVFRRYLGILAIVGILFWLQGNLLLWNYGVLDGRAIDWDRGVWRVWVDAAIWIFAMGFAACATLRFRRLIIQFAIGLFAPQVVLTALTVMGNSDALKAQPFLMGSPDALKNIHSYSTKGNVLHVIADGF